MIWKVPWCVAAEVGGGTPAGFDDEEGALPLVSMGESGPDDDAWALALACFALAVRDALSAVIELYQESGRPLPPGLAMA